MKLLTLILLIGTLSINSNTNEFTDHLNIRWILNEKTNSGIYEDLLDLNFITKDSSRTEELPAHLIYGGLTFKNDGVLIEHVWNWCGTGNPPSFHEAQWTVNSEGEQEVLTIFNSGKWNGKYLINSINKETLSLKRIE
jgi:hypothetical protein